MPEGPSILILKELIQDLHLKGETVIEATGNSKIDKSSLINKPVRAFKSWGKHFLICFDDFTIRIHLLMFGSYRINERKDSIPMISLRFENAELNFYTCAVKIIAGDLNKVYDWSADVLSKDWNARAAIAKIKKRENELICDLLLDQDIFAGVGNIIKNEVLYRSKIQPQSKVSKIPLSRLKILINEARDYSFKFLEWKKAMVLKKHWLIYNKKKCPLLHPVKRQKMGKTNRNTFFCPICQKPYEFKAAVSMP